MSTRQPKQLRIEWETPENITSRYATHMTVHASEHEFIISFYEAEPPMLIGTEEEIEQQISDLKTVKAICVARIAVANSRIGEFIQVLNRTFESQPADESE